jgi:hypothetical protein
MTLNSWKLCWQGPKNRGILVLATPLFNPLLLKSVTRVETWTWQGFEKGHLLCIAAIMMSLKREKSRFDKVTLGTLLRHVEPVNHLHLAYELLLDSNVAFFGNVYKQEEKQCLDQPDAVHRVKTGCYSYVRLAAPGTPLIDGYMNLKLRCTDKSNRGIHYTTLFFSIQTQHTNVWAVHHGERNE